MLLYEELLFDCDWLKSLAAIEISADGAYQQNAFLM